MLLLLLLILFRANLLIIFWPILIPYVDPNFPHILAIFLGLSPHMSRDPSPYVVYCKAGQKNAPITKTKIDNFLDFLQLWLIIIDDDWWLMMMFDWWWLIDEDWLMMMAWWPLMVIDSWWLISIDWWWLMVMIDNDDCLMMIDEDWWWLIDDH